MSSQSPLLPRRPISQSSGFEDPNMPNASSPVRHPNATTAFTSQGPNNGAIKSIIQNPSVVMVHLLPGNGRTGAGSSERRLSRTAALRGPALMEKKNLNAIPGIRRGVSRKDVHHRRERRWVMMSRQHPGTRTRDGGHGELMNV
ncbi:unnamed protein product [Merluccius merluccius]